MRWDCAPLDINPVFPGLGEIIISSSSSSNSSSSSSSIVISYLFAKFIITMFFLCTLFIVVQQRSFNKNSEMQVKVKLKLKVKLVGKKWWIWKISRGKVTNFSELTKFFPDEIFPQRKLSPIRYIFLQNSFSQSRIPGISSDRDYSQK